MIRNFVKYIVPPLLMLLLNPILSTAQPCGTITASSSLPLCQNEPVTFTVETSTPMGGWSTSTSFDFAFGDLPDIDTDLTSITFENGFSETTYIRAHTLSMFCYDPVLEVPVMAPITDNTISTASETIDCSTSVPVTINGTDIGQAENEGDGEEGEDDEDDTDLYLYRWQMSYGGTFWFDIPGANSPDLSMTQLPNQSIHLRRIIEPSACESDTSNTLFLEVITEPEGGTISGGGSFCNNEQISLTLSGYSGNISHWESSIDSIDYSVIDDTEGMETIEPLNAPGTHYYRAVLSKPGCGSVYSDRAVVYTEFELNNYIESEDQYLCGAQVPNPIIATSYSGENNIVSIVWESKTPSANTWNNLPNTLYINNNLYLDQPVSETRMYRRIVATENCGYSISDTSMVYVYSPSYAGQFSNSTNNQTVCDAASLDDIILQGFNQNIIDWFMAPSPGGPWESLNHTDSVYTPNDDDIDGTIYYRVLVQSETCESIFSEVYSITMYNEISGNEITSDQEICDGSAPSVLAGSIPGGGSGIFTYQWQQKTDSTDWANVSDNGTSINYTPPPLSATHYFRRVAFSAMCQSDTSNQVSVEIFDAPTGFITAESYICPEDSAIFTLHLQGTPPFAITYSNGIDTFNVDQIDTYEYAININPDAETTYSLLSVSDAYCTEGNIIEPTSVITTQIPSLANISAGANAEICGSTYTLTGSDYDPEFYEAKWFNESGQEIGTGQEIDIETQMPGVFEFTYEISNSHCPTVNSAATIVTFDFPETANAGEDIVVCSESVTMNANEINWGVGHWSIPENLEVNDPFNPQAEIGGFNNGQTYDVAWIALSLMEVCPADTSWVSISVDELSEAGNLSASATQICQGNEISLQLSNQQGTVNEWLFNYETGLENIVSDVTQIETQFNSTADVAVVVKSGICPSDTTEWINILVDSLLSPGVLTTDNQQVCTGENSGTLELTGYTGEVEFWEISNDNFETSEIINSNEDTYTFQDLSTTSQFRAKIEAGLCGTDFSNIITVDVLPQIDYTFELDEQYCSDAATVDLTDLISDTEGGVWMINGTEQSVFDPSLYGNSAVEITYVNSTGCGGSGTAITNVTESPIVWTSGNEQICGLETTIEAGNSTGNGHWESLDNIELSTNLSSQNIQAPGYGNYSIMWTAENDGCFSQETITLEFYDNPTEAQAGSDQQLELTDRAEISANTPSTGQGTWYSSDTDLIFNEPTAPTTIVNQLKIGNNEIFWKITNGTCPESISKVVIEVLPMHIPNAFSPNGDGVNDFFIISGLDAVSPVDFKVWNRWGAEVYSNQHYDNTWNGQHKNGNDLPSDTYYYSIDIPASPKTLKGFILLQR